MVNSTIPPILTKQTFVSHHKPLNIKKTQHITLEIKVLPGDRYTNVTGLKQLSGFQPSPLDNWISNGNIDINIETNFMRLLNHIFISFFFAESKWSISNKDLSIVLVCREINILLVFIDPIIVLSKFRLSFIFCNSMWSFWVEVDLCRIFIFVYICIAIGRFTY